MNNHIPGIIVFVLILMIGSYISSKNDHGYRAEAPGTDRSLVKNEFRYKKKKWRKLHSQAMGYYMDGDYVMAENTLQKILDQTQSEPAAYIAMGYIKLYRDRIYDAENSFNKALKLVPKAAEGTAGLAAVASSRGQHKKSVELYKKALSKHPNYAHLHYHIAIEYEYVRNYKNALKHYERVTALIPDTQRGIKSKARVDKINRYLEQERKNQLGYR